MPILEVETPHSLRNPVASSETANVVAQNKETEKSRNENKQVSINVYISPSLNVN